MHGVGGDKNDSITVNERDKQKLVACSLSVFVQRGIDINHCNLRVQNHL